MFDCVFVTRFILILLLPSHFSITLCNPPSSPSSPCGLFHLSPLLPRSYCTSCPSSPHKMISTSCSNISGVRRVWRMKKEHTPPPLSDCAHVVSGNSQLLCHTNISVTQYSSQRGDDEIDCFDLSRWKPQLS